jgi:ATP/maltotriose-dependent transcriptional regulator MalT
MLPVPFCPNLDNRDVFYHVAVSAPIFVTKLYSPPPPPKVVQHPHLVERLNQSLQRTRGITLISASAGLGKTTLVSA